MNFNKKNRFNFTDDLLGEQAVNKFLVEFFYEKLKEKGDIIDFSMMVVVIWQCKTAAPLLC